MPRYRKTGQPKHRPRPKASHITVDENLDPVDKNLKVDLLIKDFRKEVATRIKYLETEHTALLKWIQRQSRMEVMAFPKDMLDMKLCDFMKRFGDKQQNESSENAADVVDNDDHTDNDDDEKDEEQDEIHEMIQNVTVLKGRKKAMEATYNGPTTGGLRTRTMNCTMPPPSTRSKFQTPVLGLGKSRPGWETPMITPKFDPRLPVTTARKAKKTDKTIVSMFMSEQGSPIQTAKPSICIPSAENPNQGIHLLGLESEDSVAHALDGLDEETLQNLRRVCKLVTQFSDTSGYRK